VVSSVKNGGVSFARTIYKDTCEAAVNEQIKYGPAHKAMEG
jgi:hypothetical protein